MASTPTLDPITLEVLIEALIATVREMRATVCRTASSVAIYDAKDFSCGLFAPDSQVIAQSEDIGSHVVPLPWSVRAAIEKMGATLGPGDAILINDPYSGGTHLNDVTIIYPVFRDGRLIFFPALRVPVGPRWGSCARAPGPPGQPRFTRKGSASRRSRFSKAGV